MVDLCTLMAKDFHWRSLLTNKKRLTMDDTRVLYCDDFVDLICLKEFRSECFAVFHEVSGKV